MKVGARFSPLRTILFVSDVGRRQRNADFAFNKKGDWLAWTIDANEKIGNGVQVRNTVTGAVLPLDSDKAVYRGLNWTDKGEALAAVKGVDDKGYEDKLYSVVGFTSFAAGKPQKVAYDPREDKEFPAGMTISPNSSPSWTEDFSALLFGISGRDPVTLAVVSVVRTLTALSACYFPARDAARVDPLPSLRRD